MKQFAFFAALLAMLLFTAQCRQTDQPNQQNKNNRQKNQHSPTADSHQSKQKPGNKKGEAKMEMPERLKEAVKSGRMSKEKAMEIMKRRAGENRKSNAPLVEVKKVLRQKISSFLVLNGVVEPERKVDVYARLSTYVKQIIKEEGALVKKNETLALLDDTEIRISYNQAKIQLEQAKLTLEDEKANYNRSHELKKSDMISEQDIQLAESNYNKARLDHQTKQENFKDLELQLSYTKITAPVSGYVTARAIEVGTRVNSNQLVYTVEDFSPLLIKVYVPTADVVNLKKNMETEITTDILKGRIFNGKIKLINPRIDEQSGTVKVTVEVFDKTGRLKPGMFVETKILVRNTPDAVVIPRKSVLFRQNEAFVFVFSREQRSVSKRTIETGIAEGDNIEVLKGLDEGERIVTTGVEGLKDQMKVSTGFKQQPPRGLNQ